LKNKIVKGMRIERKGNETKRKEKRKREKEKKD